MADRITQQEHSCLAVLEDWKAPFEVAAAFIKFVSRNIPGRNIIVPSVKRHRVKNPAAFLTVSDWRASGMTDGVLFHPALRYRQGLS
jgi:hypothetical protein